MSERKVPTVPAVYVAGPLSGIKNIDGGFSIEQRKDNAITAVLVGDLLYKLGFTPHIPHSYAWMRDEALADHPSSDEDGQKVWDTVLSFDEEMILRMDVVYRIEGISAGADREVAFANANDIPVIYSLEEAEKFKDAWQAGNASDFVDKSWNSSDEGVKVRFCNSFELLCNRLGKTAKEKGFWDIHSNRAIDKLRQTFFGSPYEPTGDDKEKSIAHEIESRDINRGQLDTILQDVVKQLDTADLLGDPAIYLALISSEVFEAITALRACPANWHDKDGVWEEVADTFIRLADFVVRYGTAHGLTAYGFAEKIFAKWEMNKQRPYAHGKRF